jgi:hypothetical protein
MIIYTIEVIHPETRKPISLKALTLPTWDQVQLQIETDKRHFVDMMHCIINYTANDNQAQLSGTFGA